MTSEQIRKINKDIKSVSTTTSFFAQFKFRRTIWRVIILKCTKLILKILCKSTWFERKTRLSKNILSENPVVVEMIWPKFFSFDLSLSLKLFKLKKTFLLTPWRKFRVVNLKFGFYVPESMDRLLVSSKTSHKLLEITPKILRIRTKYLGNQFAIYFQIRFGAIGNVYSWVEHNISLYIIQCIMRSSSLISSFNQVKKKCLWYVHYTALDGTIKLN